jgi:hypothetical protein
MSSVAVSSIIDTDEYRRLFLAVRGVVPGEMPSIFSESSFRRLALEALNFSSVPSILTEAEFRRLVLLGLGIPSELIPPSIDTATWRRMVLKALYFFEDSFPSTIDTATFRRLVANANPDLSSTFYRDFAQLKTLNHGIGPDIAFTRGSHATYFDASGTLRFAPNNAVRNSEVIGTQNGVIWTPSAFVGAGVIPQWGSFRDFGTMEVTGSGTELGMRYVDVRISGTNTGLSDAAQIVAFNAFDNAAATTGQTWTSSAFVRLVGGSLDDVLSVRLVTQGRRADTSLTENSSTVFTPSSAYQRVVNTQAMANAQTARVSPDLLVVVAPSKTVDLTLRIAASQLERSPEATAYNPTTGTAYFGPRFDHDPATGASRGLLIEESRTNLLERSAEFNNAYWNKVNVTVTANDTVAPDGTTTADAVFETVDNGFHAVSRGAVVPSTGTVAMSVFAKANGRSRFGIQVGVDYGDFNLSAVTASVPFGGISASIEPISNGWYRCAFTVAATADDAYILVFLDGASNSYAGDPTKGMYFWGAQAELGAFPTSYIPTTTATATRAADSAIVNPISSFYNASEGTLFAEANPRSLTLQPNVSRVFASLNSGDFNNQINIQQRTSGDPDTVEFAPYIFPSGGPASMVGGGSLLTTTQRVAGAYKPNDFAASFNGGSAVTESSGGVPSGITHLHIGLRPNAGTGALSGHIRRIAYFPKRLSNALLQSLTT